VPSTAILGTRMRRTLTPGPVAVECKTGTGDLLEVVGKTKAGDMIVRDVEGTLFVAKELDI
jgi:hypothetical protein